MWADHRAIAEAEEITATGHRALRHVGGVMSPEMELPKLLWLKRNLPGSWDRMALALDLALERPLPASVPFTELAVVRYLEDVFLAPSDVVAEGNAR